MDTTQLALLALLVGAIIGGSVSIVIVLALRARDRAAAETSSVIPDGVREVLHGMDDAAVVVDASSTVLAASAAAVPFHLEEGGVLPSDELRGVARRVRDRRIGGDGDPAPAARCPARRAATGRRAGDAHLAPPDAARAARHHRARARRADAARLRGEHEPRAEDAGGCGQPARRGDRIGRRRPRPGAQLRRRASPPRRPVSRCSPRAS